MLDVKTIPIYQNGHLVGNAITLGERLKFFPVTDRLRDIAGQVFENEAALYRAIGQTAPPKVLVDAFDDVGGSAVSS